MHKPLAGNGHEFKKKGMRTLTSSMGLVTAAARPPLRLPLRIFMLREGFVPSPQRATLMGVYIPRRAPPKKKPRARDGPSPLHSASTPSLLTTETPVRTCDYNRQELNWMKRQGLLYVRERWLEFNKQTDALQGLCPVANRQGAQEKGEQGQVSVGTLTCVISSDSFHFIFQQPILARKDISHSPGVRLPYHAMYACAV